VRRALELPVGAGGIERQQAVAGGAAAEQLDDGVDARSKANGRALRRARGADRGELTGEFAVRDGAGVVAESRTVGINSGDTLDGVSQRRQWL
jgi:hypothetical protein